MKKVVIYTGPMCNFCSAAKHLLNKKKINYEEIDIGYDDKKREEMLKKSNGAKLSLKSSLKINTLVVM